VPFSLLSPSAQPPKAAARAQAFSLIFLSVAASTLIRLVLSPLFGTRAASIIFFPEVVFSA